MPDLYHLLLALAALSVLTTILGAVWRSPWCRGKWGEFQVNLALRWFLDRKTYTLLDNVTLPTPDGTTQIDHVVISPFGLFVIETKNMSGWIFGTEADSQWTQVIYRRKARFMNPVRQNYKHTRALCELLALPDSAVKSIVAFVGGAQLKKGVPASVTTAFGFLGYIKSFRQPLFVADDVARMAATVEAQRLAPGLATDRQHVAHVKQLKAAKAGGRQPRR